MSVSSLFWCSPRCEEKTSGNSSNACFFHCAICVGWTPYSEAISLVVFCPLIASNATLALISALYRLLGPAIGFSFPVSTSRYSILSYGPVQFLGDIIFLIFLQSY